MDRISRVFGAGFTICAIALLAQACGGAAAGGPSETISEGGAPGPAAAPASPKEEQAQKFCANAVEKAALQPPDTLSRKQIQACLIGAMPEIRTCGKGVKREVVLKIVLDKSGAVGNAFPVGDAADSPEATCVAEKVSAVKFPQFKGAAQQVIEKYPFELGE